MVDTKEHPVFLTEPSMHNKENRMKLTQILFERFKVPALFFCKSSVLAAFSCGRSTSLVLESGANSTYSVPIHDGYALQSNIIRSDIGGNFLTQQLTNSLISRGVKIMPGYASTKKIVNGQTIVDYQIYENTDPSYEKYCKTEIIRELKEATLKLKIEGAMET
jgi:actin-like protein 6A